MMTRKLALLSIAALALSVGACNYEQQTAEEQAEPTGYTQADSKAMEEPAEQAAEAANLVQDAAGVVDQMEADPGLQPLLAEAKGLFIVPHYGRGALVVGARGGEGVLVSRAGDEWNGPVFYDIGGISVGAEAGGEGGEIAMLLMTDDAVNSFEGENTFSFNAEAGVTIIDYSTYAQGSVGKGEDVILWSDTEGLFAGASLSVSDIAFDDEENAAYYRRSVLAQDVLEGNVTAPESETFLAQLPS